MIVTVGSISFAFGASILGLIVGASALVALRERDELIEAQSKRIHKLTFDRDCLHSALDIKTAALQANAEDPVTAA